VDFTEPVRSRLSRLLPETLSEKKLKDAFAKMPNCGIRSLNPQKLRHTKADRYQNVFCLRKTQVTLPDSKTPVHANWVNLKGFPREFIAAQAPKKGDYRTAYYEMLQETRCEDVVCLVSPKEQQDDPTLAYFPRTQGQAKKGWKCTHITSDRPAKYACYHLQNNQRSLRIHQYTDWPDRGVVTSSELLRFIQLVDQNSGDPTKPLTVHCRAGIGRTGVFIASYYLTHRNAKARKIISTIKKIRSQRIGAVQSPEQALLIYQTLREYQKQQARKWPSDILK
jgi:protein tyrosine phosphatase